MKNHYYLLTTVLLLPCITTTLAVKAINDTEKYPVCVADSDCEKKNLIGHACFQYFCYPWQEKATEVSYSLLYRKVASFFKRSQYIHCITFYYA